MLFFKMDQLIRNFQMRGIFNIQIDCSNIILVNVIEFFNIKNLQKPRGGKFHCLNHTM